MMCDNGNNKVTGFGIGREEKKICAGEEKTFIRPREEN